MGKQKIKKLITFTQEAWANAEKIMLDRGFNSPQEAVRFALSEIANKKLSLNKKNK